jgi:hypothetical protein
MCAFYLPADAFHGVFSEWALPGGLYFPNGNGGRAFLSNQYVDYGAIHSQN